MSTLAGKPRLRCLVLAIVSVAGVAGWQALTVHYNFGGNWTALFYTGAAFHPVPPGLAAEHIYVFPNSAGYDGQIYHYLAHDPLFRRNFAAYVDEPRYRGRRILVPGLAFLLALGHDGGIDRAYLAVIWMCTGWGVYWLGRLAQVRGYPEWLGLGFVLTPAVLVSIDRLTVDVALAACCVGFALYAGEDARYQLYAVLVAAGLSRETGLLLPAAYCICLASRRDWKRAAIFSTSALPVAGWYWFLSRHTRPDAPGLLSPVLFSGLVNRILNPYPYALGDVVNRAAIALDLLALAGICALLVWAGWRASKRAWTPVSVGVYLFAVLAMILTRGEAWSHVYAFGRTLSPLLLLAALDGWSIASFVPAYCLLAIDPRIGLEMGRQVVGVVRGILS